MWATGLEDSAYWIGQDGVLVTLTFTANDDVSDDTLEFGIGSILDGGNVVFAASGENGYYSYDDVKVEDPITVEVEPEVTDGTEPTEGTEEPDTTEPTEGTTDPVVTEPTEQPEEPDSTDDTTTDNGELGDSDSDTVLGDANLDGKVNAFDLVLAKKHVLGISLLEGQALTNADINGNGAVAANDVLLIKKFILNIIDSLG
jgi:hypothetical protein